MSVQSARHVANHAYVIFFHSTLMMERDAPEDKGAYLKVAWC
jgi:hypothetical protein